MNVLSIIALIMLTLVGYSSGMALTRGNKAIQPDLVDIFLVTLLWIGAIGTRAWLGRWWSILIWLLIALFIASIATAVRRAGAVESIPDSELPEHARQGGTDNQSQGIFARMWRGWTHFAEEMGNVQGRLLMGFFYFVVVTPFGIGTRLFSDPMRIKSRPKESGWVEKEPIDRTLEQAREQG